MKKHVIWMLVCGLSAGMLGCLGEAGEPTEDEIVVAQEEDEIASGPADAAELPEEPPTVDVSRSGAPDLAEEPSLALDDEEASPEPIGAEVLTADELDAACAAGDEAACILAEQLRDGEREPSRGATSR